MIRQRILLLACAMSALIGWAPPPPAGSVSVDLDDATPFVDFLARRRDPTLPARYGMAVNALQAVMFGECRGQGLTCMTMVGMTAINRVKAHKGKRYGNGIIGVIAKPYAFSCMLSNDPNWRVIKAGIEGRLAPHSPDGIAWTIARGESLRIANAFLRGDVLNDPTNNATYYHAANIRPKWIHDRGMIRTALVAGHVFYKG